MSSLPPATEPPNPAPRTTGPAPVAPAPETMGPVPTGPAPTGPASTPAAPARNGTIAWALGFLAYVPIPFVGLVIAGITQLIVGLGQRKHGGLAAANGVRAANWGLTQLCWPVLMALTMLIAVLTGVPSSTGDGMMFHPVMNVLVFTMLGLFFVVCLLQAVYAIVGTVMASKGRRVGLPVIRFLRAPRG